MNPNNVYHNLSGYIPFFLLISVLIIIYGNSLKTDWQMDDQPNIINNPGLHIDNLLPESLWGTFFANQGKAPALYRPLPCLTFALNWYVGKDNPFGYHVVNLGCHMAAAWALYLLIGELLTILYKNDRRRQSWIQNVALLSTVLWAANPIQTQAVTYIVQRMAIMATLFYVLGMLYFIKARIADTISQRWAYGAICFLFFLCGVGSKENAVMLPVSLVLVEWIFFNQGSLSILAQPKALAGGIVLVVGALVTVYFTIGLPLHYILTGYADRPFTMMERLMTEPQIVLGYLSQIFFPIPDRLSIAHDVTLSTSLIYPWTTIPAIALVLILIIGALTVSKRFPLLSFSVLFYFINHSVESTVLPLELVFEHRNYLPSLFLFLPLSTLFCDILMRLPRHSLRHVGSSGIMIAVIIVFGFFTHTRNKAWATSESLWRDAALKAPASTRPLVNLGIKLAWRDYPTADNYRHALVLFQRSLDLGKNRTKEQADILGNMASVYFLQGNNEKAIEIYYQALKIDPDFIKNRFDLIKPLVVTGQFNEAEIHARQLLNLQPLNPDYLNVMGLILLWEDKPEEALAYLQNALANGISTPALMLNIGVALTRVNSWQNAEWFLQKASHRVSDDLYPKFALIENRVRAGDRQGAVRYAEQMNAIFPASAISSQLKSSELNFRSAPLDLNLIVPVICSELHNSIDEFYHQNCISHE